MYPSAPVVKGLSRARRVGGLRERHVRPAPTPGAPPWPAIPWPGIPPCDACLATHLPWITHTTPPSPCCCCCCCHCDAMRYQPCICDHFCPTPPDRAHGSSLAQSVLCTLILGELTPAKHSLPWRLLDRHSAQLNIAAAAVAVAAISACV